MNEETNKQKGGKHVAATPKPRHFGVIKIIDLVEHYLIVHPKLQREWTERRGAATAFVNFSEAKALAKMVGGLTIEIETSQLLFPQV